MSTLNFDKLAVPLYRRSPVAKLEESNDGNKTFEVQVYQVHLATFHVHAQSTAEAIRYLMNGDGDELLDSPQYHSRCNERGMLADDALLSELNSLGIPVEGRIVSSIAGVKDVCGNE